MADATERPSCLGSPASTTHVRGPASSRGSSVSGSLAHDASSTLHSDNPHTPVVSCKGWAGMGTAQRAPDVDTTNVHDVGEVVVVLARSSQLARHAARRYQDLEAVRMATPHRTVTLQRTPVNNSTRAKASHVRALEGVCSRHHEARDLQHPTCRRVRRAVLQVREVRQSCRQ